MSRTLVLRNAAGEVVAREVLPDDATPAEVETVKRRLQIIAAMAMVERAVGQHFPEALDSLKAALAVHAVGCIADNAQPTSVILIAVSGAGKTLQIELMMPEGDDDPINKYFYRSDNFTPASFVSHRADRSEDELRQTDMLPRIKDKTVLVKEMAPWFGGKRDDLLQKFAVLAAVLDGKGFVSDSGAHGRRGYQEPINFRLIGATTPLSSESLEVMANVGPRLLFYDADRRRKGADELVEYARRRNVDGERRYCRKEVAKFLTAFHDFYPTARIDSAGITIGQDRLRQIALWADVMTRLRAKVSGKGGVEVERVEHPERALGMLRHFSIGSALIHGRAAVDEYDLAQVAHVALSSGVAGRARVFRALLRAGVRATSPRIEAYANVTRPTVHRYMKELDAVGLARFTEGKGKVPHVLELVDPYTELCAAPQLKANRREGETDESTDELKAKGGEGGSGPAEPKANQGGGEPDGSYEELQVDWGEGEAAPVVREVNRGEEGKPRA